MISLKFINLHRSHQLLLCLWHILGGPLCASQQRNRHGAGAEGFVRGSGPKSRQQCQQEWDSQMGLTKTSRFPGHILTILVDGMSNAGF